MEQQKWLSGKLAWDTIVRYWPMDAYATYLCLVLLFAVWAFKVKPARLREYALAIENFTIRLITFYWFWVFIRGLCFSKDEDIDVPKAERRFIFDPIKSAFVLCCFVVLFRLSVGGREFGDIEVGPNVQITAVESTDPKAKKEIPKARPWFSIKKIKTDPINFYELLALLIFAGLYYYRRDLKEGDQSNGLDRLLDWIGRAYALKISNGAVGGAQPEEPTSDASGATSVITKDLTEPHSRLKKAEGSIGTIKNDPFIK